MLFVKKPWIDIFNLSRFQKLNDKEQIELIHRLYDLLNYGFTLSESFEFLIKHIKIKSTLVSQTILSELRNGAHCYQILKILKYPNTVVMLIYFAEMFSDLSESLMYAQDYLARNYKAKQSLIKTVQYPVVLMAVFITMLVILNHTIIPEFHDLYESMDVLISTVQLYLTQIIINLPSIICYFIFIILLIIVIVKILYRKLPIKYKHQFVLTIPILSKIFKLYKTYRIASEFSLFYKNGINLQKIVDIYTHQSDDVFLKYLANEIKIGTQKGYNLSEILTRVSCFEKELISFIKEGEKKGRLDIELKLYSEMILSKIEKYLQFLIKFIQPCIFTLLAFFIVSLYLVIMLPMFDLMQTIK